MALPPALQGMMGGPRPPMPQLPGGTGATMTPSPMGGSMAQGMTALKQGLEFLQKALPQLPMGSEVWSSVHKALGDIGKHMDQTMGAGGGPSAIQQLVQMARDQHTDPLRNAMMAGLPGGGPPPGGGASPSSAPPPGPMGMAA